MKTVNEPSERTGSSINAGGPRTALPYDRPSLVSFEITNKCNYNCIYCYNRDESGPEMSVEQIREHLVPQLKEARIRTICIIGGEPLIRVKDIVAISQDLNGIDTLDEIMISTNGYLLNEDIFKTLKRAFPEKLVYFSIPLDSLNKEIVQAYRTPKKDVFERTMQTIRLLKRKRAIFTIDTVVTHETIDELEDTINFVRTLGPRVAMEVFPYHPVAAEQQHLRLAPRDYQKLDEIRCRYLGDPILPWDNAPCPYDPKLLSRLDDILTKHNVLTLGCSAGNNSLCVTATGDITPCNYLRERLGNIFETTIMEVYDNNETVLKLRNREVGGRCGSCKHKIECGGCRTRALFETGDLFGGVESCLGSPEGHPMYSVVNKNLKKACRRYAREIRLFQLSAKMRNVFRRARTSRT